MLFRSRDGRATRGWAAAYLFAGIIAGLCNEHTGPTLCLGTLAFAWWTHARNPQRPLLAWAGALGAVVGFAVILFLMYEPQGLARIWVRFRSYWQLWPYSY